MITVGVAGTGILLTVIVGYVAASPTFGWTGLLCHTPTSQTVQSPSKTHSGRMHEKSSAHFTGRPSSLWDLDPMDCPLQAQCEHDTKREDSLSCFDNVEMRAQLRLGGICLSMAIVAKSCLIDGIKSTSKHLHSLAHSTSAII